jgi:glycine cleavage system H protein
MQAFSIEARCRHAYGGGWMLKVRPADWGAAKPKLIPGTAVAEPYEAKMAADAFVGCAAAAA